MKEFTFGFRLAAILGSSFSTMFQRVKLRDDPNTLLLVNLVFTCYTIEKGRCFLSTSSEV